MTISVTIENLDTQNFSEERAITIHRSFGFDTDTQPLTTLSPGESYIGHVWDTSGLVIAEKKLKND